ncbi:MAG: putative lipid II flippase FtsW [Patescibacteria group bacterium]
MIKNIKYLSQKNTMDLPLLVTVLILIGFGLVMVYDVSPVQALRDAGDSNFYIRQQLIWASIGILSMVFFSQIDYRILKKFSTPALVGSFVLMLAVLIPSFGFSGGGAQRWLQLGPVTFQPAEFMKLTGIIFLSTVFTKGSRFFPLLTLCFMVTAVTAILQRDLGSTIIFVFSSSILYLASGGAIWHFLVALPLSLAAISVLIFTSPYRVQRILAFLDPFQDTQGFTYHISQVLIALGSGGLLGLGLGHSRQKFEYIPEVTTDSIFGVVGEEFGFLGGATLVILFAILVLRGIKISQQCSDNFGRILAIGLTSWLGVQTVINLSSMVALLPLTGVPLPFISYGGSALVANLTAVGILLNISKQNSSA